MIGKILRFNVHGDERGNLVALEKSDNFPFAIKRVYYVWGTDPQAVRGKHSHFDLEQVAICTSGSCDFILDDGRQRETYHLSDPSRGLYISGNIWREFTNFAPNTVVMVLASEVYDPKDYIRDYATFLKTKGINHDTYNSGSSDQ